MFYIRESMHYWLYLSHKQCRTLQHPDPKFLLVAREIHHATFDWIRYFSTFWMAVHWFFLRLLLFWDFPWLSPFPVFIKLNSDLWIEFEAMLVWEYKTGTVIVRKTKPKLNVMWSRDMRDAPNLRDCPNVCEKKRGFSRVRNCWLAAIE